MFKMYIKGNLPYITPPTRVPLSEWCSGCGTHDDRKCLFSCGCCCCVVSLVDNLLAI